MLKRPAVRRDLAADLDLALKLADFGSRLTLRRFVQGPLHVVDKADGTPVSDADMAAESEIRRRLEAARPDDGILGEEFGPEGNQASRWIIDPIDGTANFICEDPNWAVLIALEVDRQVVVGVVSAPALGRRWWAGCGLGAWADGRRLQVGAEPRRLDDATITSQARSELSRLGQADPLRRSLDGNPAADAELFWGDLLVAQGDADIDICLDARLWDLAARKVVVTEAGGRFTDIAGRDRIDTGTALAATPLVHDELLSAVGGVALPRGARGRPPARHIALA